MELCQKAWIIPYTHMLMLVSLCTTRPSSTSVAFCLWIVIPSSNSLLLSLPASGKHMRFIVWRFSVSRKMASSSLSPSYGLNKVLKLGIRSIWLCGFLLIILSLYATHLLPSIADNANKTSNSGSTDNPSITICTVLSTFTGIELVDRQSLAIRSWLGLSPVIVVVLFGNHPSLHDFASSFDDSRVMVEPNIDFSFTGSPFFHSIFTRALTFSSDITVLIDPETILLPNFISALNYAHRLDQDWFLIASPREVSSNFHFDWDDAASHWVDEDGQEIKLKKLQDIVSQNGEWDYCDKKMLMAWNRHDLLPLHMGVVPPFLYGRGLHNYWLINEVFHSEFRFVFDASWAISSFYLNISDSSRHFSPTVDLKKNSSWEYEGNLHLAQLYGLLNFRKVNFFDFVKLVDCNDGDLLFTNSAFDAVYSSSSGTEQSSGHLLKLNPLQFRKERRAVNCLDRLSSLATRGRNCSPAMRELDHHPVSFVRLPYEMNSLVRLVADGNKTIVLGVAGYSYKDMLMSWVCRLRSLQITNFLVCALDDDVYQFSVLQGLPVYKDSFAPSNISFNDCHFGTECFQRVTKSKSRLVLQILKLGYSVLMSDVDVYWFKNPLPLLQSFGSSVLVAQSDEFNLTGPINVPRRLNSGFYFARSDNATIAGVEKVVKHALTSDLSEQPSFYDMLCGEGGSNRVGDDKCLEPEINLTVHFLSRDLFPNGAYAGLWEEADVRGACEKKGCYVLHNNWINSRLKKVKRQVSTGLWGFDMGTRMCIRSWHKQLQTKDYI